MQQSEITCGEFESTDDAIGASEEVVEVLSYVAASGRVED
jgi:hypothetical protein